LAEYGFLKDGFPEVGETKFKVWPAARDSWLGRKFHVVPSKRAVYTAKYSLCPPYCTYACI
jgi:hypothetical protein